MTRPTRTKTRGGCRARQCVAVRLVLLLCAVLSIGGNAASNGAVDIANCALCQGLKYCTAMNGKLLFDPVIGYTREKTSQLEKQGVCEDMDAKTLELSKFGDQYQFKDTERCHKLVWNYHCLSLVAATFQRVINGVAVSCDHAASSSVGKPLPPCRSLCVEIADKCVYSHFYRDYLENVCGNVPCVSEEQEANSGGTLKQAACIKAPWESVPNTSFSRCSIREYVPPKAHAAHPFSHAVVLAISTLNALLLGQWRLT